MVILITLVIPGLTIGPLLRWLKIEDKQASEKKKNEQLIKLSLAQATLTYIDQHFAEDILKDEHFKAVRHRYERAIQLSKQKLETIETKGVKTIQKSAPRLKKCCWSSSI
ncbi:hypothetical protein KRR40_14800 [Niabella defluvii]|nr:hypothetical protein KRR40_14800 [Niabella sp. I65]